MATPEQRDAAASVVQQLSAVCDGAVEMDGQGFNRLDSRFGKELASRSIHRALTDGEVDVVKRLAKKYRRQLNTELVGTLWLADRELLDGEMFGGFL